MPRPWREVLGWTEEDERECGDAAIRRARLETIYELKRDQLQRAYETAVREHNKAVRLQRKERG